MSNSTEDFTAGIILDTIGGFVVGLIIGLIWYN